MRKQIEDREALKTAVEALDAPTPDEGAAPKGGPATAPSLPPPLKRQGLCRLRKSTG